MISVGLPACAIIYEILYCVKVNKSGLLLNKVSTFLFFVFLLSLLMIKQRTQYFLYRHDTPNVYVTAFMLKTQKQKNLMIIIYLTYVTITFMNIFDLSLQTSNIFLQSYDVKVLVKPLKLDI